MAGVDARAYTDLILDDRTPQELVRVAVQQLAIALPDITLREGHTESVLIEAVALMVSETIYALNQAPAATTETLTNLQAQAETTFAAAAAKADELADVAEDKFEDLKAEATVQLEAAQVKMDELKAEASVHIEAAKEKAKGLWKQFFGE